MPVLVSINGPITGATCFEQSVHGVGEKKSDYNLPLKGQNFAFIAPLLREIRAPFLPELSATVELATRCVSVMDEYLTRTEYCLYPNLVGGLTVDILDMIIKRNNNLQFNDYGRYDHVREDGPPTDEFPGVINEYLVDLDKWSQISTKIVPSELLERMRNHYVSVHGWIPHYQARVKHDEFHKWTIPPEHNVFSKLSRRIRPPPECTDPEERFSGGCKLTWCMHPERRWDFSAKE